MAQIIELMRMSRVSKTGAKKPAEELDSVKASQMDDRHRGMEVLWMAHRYYSNMDRFRKERRRNKKYCYGDQWSDMIKVDGKWITEEQYLLQQGNVPLKNNLIRRLVKNVLGVYRSQCKEPTCVARDRDEQKLGETMSSILQCNRQLNRMNEVDARSVEEFLISGLIVHKKWFGWRNNKMDCWTDYITPNNFFVDNNMRDFRTWDCTCVGEIHDTTFNELCSEFASSPEDYKKLKAIYSNAADRRNIADNCRDFGYDHHLTWDFFTPVNPTLCRVIEVWRKELKPRYRCHDFNNGDVYKIDAEDYDVMVTAQNALRMQQAMDAGIPPEEVPLIEAQWFMDSYWYYYYLTPFGDILREGETRYQHKSHPYVFKMFPFIDGEIHSFVADVIDQQRYVNRLISLYDWIMRTSAKGALLFPEECLPDGYRMEDIADEWSRVNGLIVFKAKAGVAMPQQIANNCTNIGIGELLNLQLKFFEDISGVNGALQGKPGYAGTSGNLYAQQTQNATMSLLDFLDTYSAFVVDCAYKDIKNMQQFYDTKRVFNIVGKTSERVVYDPKKIRDVEFDLSVTESTATPAYRQLANDFLMQIWQSGQINLQQMLTVGEFPFGDQLLQSLQSQQESIQRGVAPQQMDPALMQQVQAQTNPQALQQAQQMLQVS